MDAVLTRELSSTGQWRQQRSKGVHNVKSRAVLWIIGTASVLIAGWALAGEDGSRFLALVTVPLFVLFVLLAVSLSKRRRPPG
ncbi:hypothetical protein [Clavibacter sp. VKM Ac-2872]|uniref:hypothetical protein n=1 Tax=Clavibacter sp. VKM Ac-2872 TaxID=2783812 RepID=UPI00188CBDEE|nr:hypothetical protein [Clavibacter sp. VKM Ac-2872]MBF4623465.1 hypothetical protein [Clavibacter sp. VKM Ac-2872]